MQAYWFYEKLPADGQLIHWTFNGRSRTSDDRPFDGPYTSFGRYCAALHVVVSATLEVWQINAGYAWHPLPAGYELTHATLKHC